MYVHLEHNCLGRRVRLLLDRGPVENQILTARGSAVDRMLVTCWFRSGSLSDSDDVGIKIYADLVREEELAELCANPYLRRIWIVQQMALGFWRLRHNRLGALASKIYERSARIF